MKQQNNIQGNFKCTYIVKFGQGFAILAKQGT